MMAAAGLEHSGSSGADLRHPAQGGRDAAGHGPGTAAGAQDLRFCVQHRHRLTSAQACHRGERLLVLLVLLLLLLPLLLLLLSEVGPDK